MIRIAALASHGGSILQAVMDACAEGTLDAQVVLVCSNNSNAQVLERAQALDIPTLHLSQRTHAEPADLDRALHAALSSAKPDFILLAGYMKKLGPEVLAGFRGRILNKHPSLLPKYGGKGFFGRKVHEAVVAAGDSTSGASMHMVDVDYDTGPLLSQVRVNLPINPTADEVERLVKIAERRLVVATMQHLSKQPEPDDKPTDDTPPPRVRAADPTDSSGKATGSDAETAA